MRYAGKRIRALCRILLDQREPCVKNMQKVVETKGGDVCWKEVEAGKKRGEVCEKTEKAGSVRSQKRRPV